MTNHTDEEANILKKLTDAFEDGTLNAFSKEEIDVLRRMVKVFMAFEVLGTIGGMIKTVLLWFGVIITSWIAIKGGVIAWIVNLR